MAPALRLDLRDVHPLEVPDEGQDLRQVGGAMELAGLANPRDGAPQAQPARTVEPNDEVGPGQAQVEARLGEVAVANPGRRAVGFVHRGPEAGEVAADGRRGPGRVEVDHRDREPLTQAPGEPALAAARAAQDHEPPRRDHAAVSSRRPALAMVSLAKVQPPGDASISSRVRRAARTGPWWAAIQAVTAATSRAGSAGSAGWPAKAMIAAVSADCSARMSSMRRRTAMRS